MNQVQGTANPTEPTIMPETPELAMEARGGAEGLERKLLIALCGGVLLASSWIAKLVGIKPEIAQFPAFLGSVVLVIPLVMGACREIGKGRPSSDSLASLAVLAAMASQMYLAAGFLALFLWMANLILSRTAWGAQRAIRELLDLPSTSPVWSSPTVPSTRSRSPRSPLEIESVFAPARTFQSMDVSSAVHPTSIRPP